MTQTNLTRIAACMFLFTLSSLSPCPILAQAPGKSMPVSTDELVGAVFTQRTGRQEYEFELSFRGEQIVLETDTVSDRFKIFLAETSKNARSTKMTWNTTPGKGYELGALSQFTRRDKPSQILSGTGGSHNCEARIWYQPATFQLIGRNIPKDLLAGITGDADLDVYKVEGNWKIEQSDIVFDNVKINGKTKIDGQRKLYVFFTGVLRIQTDAAQYVD